MATPREELAELMGLDFEEGFLDPLFDLEEDDGRDDIEAADPLTDGEYWAAGDVGHVIDKVIERRDKISESLSTSTVFNKAFRSLQYYYGFFEDEEDWGDTAIQLTGEHGQLLTFDVNVYRYCARQLLSLITSRKIRYRVAPANTTAKARNQARLGKRLVNYYFKKKGVEKRLRDVAEDAFIFGVGFAKVCWNPTLGAEYEADERTGDVFYEGDVDVQLVSLGDVIWDYENVDRWEDLEWIAHREWVNKYDLAARYPEYSDEILSDGIADDDSPEDWDPSVDSDRIPVYWYYHRRSDALPLGREVLFLGERALHDLPLSYKRIPLYPMHTGRVRKTLLGWSPLFNIQKPVELLNQELQYIASMHDNLGLPMVWVPESTSQPDPQEWAGNISYVQSQKPPALIDLSSVPEDHYRLVEMLLGRIKEEIGINPAIEAQAEGSVRANRMQLFMSEQAMRFNNEAEHGYAHLVETVGTAILETIGEFAQSERLIPIIGENDRSSFLTYSAEDLDEIQGITVEEGSPLEDTIEGRLEMLKVFSEARVDIPKEEVVALLQGAPLSTIVERHEGQLELAAQENEDMLVGQPHRPLHSDNHLLHFKKHAAILNNPTVRTDPRLERIATQAMQEHLILLLQPGIMAMQIAQGYIDPAQAQVLVQFMASGGSLTTAGPETPQGAGGEADIQPMPTEEMVA